MIFLAAVVLATMLLVQRKRTIIMSKGEFNCGATPAGGEVFCCIFYGVYNNNNKLQYNYNYIYRCRKHKNIC